MTRKEYKPRLGFDIRVKPPGRTKKAPAWSEPGDHSCAADDCDEKAACSLPKSPREPRARIWLCLAHARDHNRNWNYFDGLSEDEAAKVRQAAQYGDRPTWSMGKNDRARAAANARGPADADDAFGLMAESVKERAEERGHYRGGKKLTKLQVGAFDTMALQYNATSSEIRRRYAELVRRFHPDSNGGDRSAEEQLSEVVKAHTILKKAQFV
ncbi:J domain-containing protein [Hyphococcus formosus]|uniref:J domain-containing protein n=1 Tax=Hyphococcus formosus TaxID=3143534 RepID=UPI00398B4FD7